VRGKRKIEATLQPLHRRIEKWHTTRARRTRMPEELWEAAVEASREFGLWSVSQVLRVNCESLKSRLHAGPATSRSAAPTAPSSGFVECTVEDLLRDR
jgi:hypothetical protein